MNGADLAILAVIGLSSVISIMRGFVKEAMSLFAWIAAFIVATMFRDPMATLLAPSIDNVSVRYMTAYGILFVCTLILGAVLNMLMSQLIKATGLSGIDRVLGTGFGIARGVLIVMLLMYVLQFVVPVEEEDLWRSSYFVPHLMVIQDWIEVVFSDVLAEVRE